MKMYRGMVKMTVNISTSIHSTLCSVHYDLRFVKTHINQLPATEKDCLFIRKYSQIPVSKKSTTRTNLNCVYIHSFICN